MSKVKRRRDEWFDDEAFWRELYPALFDEQRFAVASETVEKALKLAQPKGKIALDLCCGPGRCAIALANLGFKVTGVDRTRFLLEKARRRARAAGRSIEWIRADMRDFVRPHTYDFVLNAYTSFGYFDDRREDDAVLSNVFKSLRPRGAFLMEMMGKEIMAKSFADSSVQTLPDGTTLVQQRTVIDDWTRCVTNWTVISKGVAKTFTFKLNLYSAQELREALERAGFTGVQFFGDMDGRPYGTAAERLIAVGRKPRPDRERF